MSFQYYFFAIVYKHTFLWRSNTNAIEIVVRLILVFQFHTLNCCRNLNEIYLSNNNIFTIFSFSMSAAFNLME